MESNYIGKKVIIRADRAGVFFGELVRKEKDEVELQNCRRLYRWYGATECIQLAVDGVSNQDDSLFTTIAKNMEIRGVVEIIPCEEKAIKSIEGVQEWKR